VKKCTKSSGFTASVALRRTNFIARTKEAKDVLLIVSTGTIRKFLKSVGGS
jgi:hypothetical protein